MFGGIAGRPFSAGISEVAQRVDEGPRRGQGRADQQHGERELELGEPPASRSQSGWS